MLKLCRYEKSNRKEKNLKNKIDNINNLKF